MIGRLRRLRPRLASLGLACALGAGCQATPEDLAHWKLTEKGPGKLREVLEDPGGPAPLRAQAAVALIEIGQGAEVAQALQRMPEPSRRAVLKDALPPLVRAVSADAEPSGTTHTGPRPREIREDKDALFRLRTLIPAEDPARTQAEDALIRWTTADLTGRMSAGSIGSELILSGLGARAQEALVAVLQRSAADSPNLLPAASLLGRVGDSAAKARGAQRLVQLVEPVLAVKGTPPESIFQAIGLLGGDDAVRFLMDAAQHGQPEHRKKALLALAQTGAPAALQLGLQIAGDRREPRGVREAAFDYLEKAGPIAVPGLRKLMADPGDPTHTGEIVRFRALDAALAAGGAQGDALRTTLEALPTNHDYLREDLRAYVSHRITPFGPPVLPALRELLRSPSWVARAAGILALGEMGQPADVAVLEGIGQGGDATKARGKDWNGVTLAALAREQAQNLKALRSKR